MPDLYGRPLGTAPGEAFYIAPAKPTIPEWRYLRLTLAFAAIVWAIVIGVVLWPL